MREIWLLELVNLLKFAHWRDLPGLLCGHRALGRHKGTFNLKTWESFTEKVSQESDLARCTRVSRAGMMRKALQLLPGLFNLTEIMSII